MPFISAPRVTTTYIIRVVEVEDAAPLLLDRLVAAHTAVERRIHVHVVAREIETDEALEEDGPLCVCRGEEAEQTRGRAAVRHHVEDRAELCRLVECAGGIAVEGVEQAGDGVEESAVVGVVWHEVEGCAGEDDAGVACACRWLVFCVALRGVKERMGITNQVWDEEEYVLSTGGVLWGHCCGVGFVVELVWCFCFV